MDGPDPGLDDVIESVIRCGGSTGYQMGLDDAGQLQLTATDDTPGDPPVKFVFSEQELWDYYVSCTAPSSISRDTPWETWLMLMSTRLDESVWKATTLNMECVISISPYGFHVVPR